MVAKGGYVYIVSNQYRTTFYIGVTSNLSAHSYEHKHDEGSKFSSKYKCTDLISYEIFDCIESAIEREKALKKWSRLWKEKLIREFNPDLRDLYQDVKDLD